MALFRFISELPAPPGVGASCLRKQFARQTCQACVDICPVNAVSFSGSSPVIDETVCIGCGHCLFSCPVDALENIRPATRRIKKDLLVAPFSALPPVTEELLMWHYQRGIRQVELNMNEHPGWVVAIAELNVRLQKLNQPLWLIAPPQTKAVNLSRRHLLHVAQEDVTTSQVAVGRRARRQQIHSYSEYELSLTLSQCMACGACARACSEQALRFSDNVLEWSSQPCTGCGNCAAVCPSGAVTILERVHANDQKHFTFISKVCAGCQHPFYVMDTSEENCHICRNHSYGMREA